MKEFNESIRGKLFNYFRGRLDIKASTKGWWRCNCIECGGSYSMGIHLEHRKAHCFKCNMEKPTLHILMDIEGFETYSQAYGFLNIQQEYEHYNSYQKVQQRDFKQIELPESYRLLSQGDGMWGKTARNYMRGRGFNIDHLSLKGVGYCTEGEYAGYIIFPFFRQGKLIYFQGRLFFGNGPKMHNPPSEEFGIGKTQIIYNQDALYMYDRIRVVESITNAETLGDSAIATLGKSISPYQLSCIISSPCTKADLILDPDAYKEAIETAMQLVHYKKVRVVKLPNGDKDVNDYGKGKTISFIKKARYMNYMELFRIKLTFNEPRPEHTYNQVGPYKGIGRSR